MRCSFLSLPCYCRHAACRLLLLLLCPPATNKGGSPRQKVLGPAQMYVSVNGGWVSGWGFERQEGHAWVGGWWEEESTLSGWVTTMWAGKCVSLHDFLLGRSVYFYLLCMGFLFKSMLFTLYLCTIFLIWQQLIVTHCMSEYLKALYDVRHFDFSHKCSCSCRIGLKLQVFALKQASFVIGSFYLSVNLKWNEIIF